VTRKVLIIVENSPVPADPRVWAEALALRRAGYQVSVICPGDSRRKLKWRETIEGVHIYRHWAPREGLGRFSYLVEYLAALPLEFALAVWVYLRRGFQVIQGCNPPDTIFLVAAPFKLLGVKYIFDHHDASPELYWAKYERRDFAYRIQVWLERLTYWFSDVVIATNESYRQLAIERGSRKPEQVFVVRNGPNLDRVKRLPLNPQWRKGKRFLVGYVGVMAEQDGLDLLVQTAAHFKRTGRLDTHFACVGAGPSLESLRERVRALGLADMVTFTGRLPDREMLEILSTADVCVNPDKPCEMNNISTMIKIMEYMALAKPIVQFESREGRVSAGESSLYADPRAGIQDFAEKIQWLLDHPKEREEMGALGRRRVDEKLAWKYSIPHLLAAYDRAFQRRGSKIAPPEAGAGETKTAADLEPVARESGTVEPSRAAAGRASSSC